MAKYVYPAIFSKEEVGYSIRFPDIPGCFTQGDDLKDGMEMASDVLALVLYGYETDGETTPEPSDIKSFTLKSDETAMLIVCDTTNYGENVL